ncbi:methyltransferase, FkbM family [Yoonia tamlensis]|uniref:Methyltransferase, FkbM family n=1 Tax=Yoonia tamlensis TaxID=390270 RepID=A0A1I6G0B4_9RHOB|nr:methyltransferase domain-containing protein [Yoonia tamlensis]SFR35635.1 methyltransferase, FkbM family [Yoonia tamlensis]
MLSFDAKTARLLDDVYAGSDCTRRRQESFDALKPAPGEVILDIGAGNGLLTGELARAVGPSGRVIAVEPSADMRASAQARCAGFDWVEIVDGTADSLPAPAETIDKAVAVQVFEYLQDIPRAVTEVHRVLRKDGRLVIGDIHFDSLVWHTDNPDRMARMQIAWDHHFTTRNVPAQLPAILRATGFCLDAVTPVTVCDYQLRPDGLARMMIILMRDFAIAGGHVPTAEATAWADEQTALAAQGRFFFAVTHFVTSARKT